MAAEDLIVVRLLCRSDRHWFRGPVGKTLLFTCGRGEIGSLVRLILELLRVISLRRDIQDDIDLYLWHCTLIEVLGCATVKPWPWVLLRILDFGRERTASQPRPTPHIRIDVPEGFPVRSCIAGDRLNDEIMAILRVS